jgi:small subunit ribosomal protein S1
VEGEDEIEGLIHVSELADGHIEHPRDVVTEGQALTLRVLKIEADKRRMGLSLTRVSSADYENVDWETVAAATPDLDEVVGAQNWPKQASRAQAPPSPV